MYLMSICLLPSMFLFIVIVIVYMSHVTLLSMEEIKNTYLLTEYKIKIHVPKAQRLRKLTILSYVL